MARNSIAPFRAGVGGGDPFLSLHREMNRLFDDVFRGGIAGPTEDSSAGFVPARINVSETDNELRITAELPGVSQNDVEITLNDDILTIRGEKRFENKDDRENFHFVECSYGTFQRSMRLPYATDPDQVQATFENGVLTVTLPKNQAKERSRRIQVQGKSERGRSDQGKSEQGKSEQSKSSQGKGGKGS